APCSVGSSTTASSPDSRCSAAHPKIVVPAASGPLVAVVEDGSKLRVEQVPLRKPRRHVKGVSIRQLKGWLVARQQPYLHLARLQSLQGSLRNRQLRQPHIEQRTRVHQIGIS